MTAIFRNTKYPALRFYAGGQSHKFQGGRLAVEDEEMAQAIRDMADDRNGILEEDAEQVAPSPEAKDGPTTQEVLDQALEMGIIDEPMEAEDSVAARIEDGALVLTFGDDSTLTFKDGEVMALPADNAQDGQNAAADAEEAANTANTAEEPQSGPGDAVAADGPEAMNREQLRDALRVRGLPTSGNVPELRERLAGAMQA